MIDSSPLQQLVLTVQGPQATSNANKQSECPLFRIPVEVRNHIFKLAVTTYEDPNLQLRPEQSTSDSPSLQAQEGGWPKYRIGHQFKRRTCTELLQTCKRIYNETKFLPVSINEHCISSIKLNHTMGPLYSSGFDYFVCMTQEHLAAVQKVRVFTARSFLTNTPSHIGTDIVNLYPPFGELRTMQNGMKPKEITITITYDQWDMPHLSEGCLEAKLWNWHCKSVLGGVRVLTIEMDKKSYERRELERHVEFLLGLDFDIGNNEVLVADDSVKSYSWTAPIYERFNCRSFWQNQEFFGMAVTWRVQKRDHSKRYSFTMQ